MVRTGDPGKLCLSMSLALVEVGRVTGAYLLVQDISAAQVIPSFWASILASSTMKEKEAGGVKARERRRGPAEIDIPVEEEFKWLPVSASDFGGTRGWDRWGDFGYVCV